MSIDDTIDAGDCLFMRSGTYLQAEILVMVASGLGLSFPRIEWPGLEGTLKIF